MVNNNEITIEVKKPFETVYEIKNETPSFEEFMKNYENDESLNYDDLSGGGFSEVKGYGPCTSSYSCSSYELRRQLKQKQEDLDSLWEKFREYDSKWENYKKAMDSYFSSMDFLKNNPISEVMNNPFVKVATELIPGAGLFTLRHDMSVSEAEREIESVVKSSKKSCYSAICDKYNEIKDWYWRIRNR